MSATDETLRSIQTSRRGRWAAGAIALLVMVAVGVLWFEPHTLFLDDSVDEALPSPSPSASPSASPSPQLVELGTGSFISLDHTTSGSVRLLESSEAVRTLRLDALDTSNGPDLYVYLSTNRADGEEAAFDDDVVNLGRLKGNRGDQNYVVPADVDLRRYKSVVIWCDRFNSAFGAAAMSIA